MEDAYMKAFLEAIEKFNEDKVRKLLIEINKDEVYIKSFGSACHGGTPETGIIAVIPVYEFLSFIGNIDNGLNNFARFVASCIGDELIKDLKQIIYFQSANQQAFPR